MIVKFICYFSLFRIAQFLSLSVWIIWNEIFKEFSGKVHCPRYIFETEKGTNESRVTLKRTVRHFYRTYIYRYIAFNIGATNIFHRRNSDRWKHIRNVKEIARGALIVSNSFLLFFRWCLLGFFSVYFPWFTVSWIYRPMKIPAGILADGFHLRRVSCKTF